MKVAFVQCPAWVIYSPPYAPALIGAALQKSGHIVKCYDLNIGLYNKLQNENAVLCSIDQYSWEHDRIETDWVNEKNTFEIFSAFKSYFEEILKDINLFGADIVCFTVQRTSAYFSMIFANFIKQNHPVLKILWGGPFCFKSCIKPEFLAAKVSEIDGICYSDGDKSLPFVLSYLEKNSVFPAIPGYYFRNHETEIYSDHPATFSELDNIPFADYTLFELDKYSIFFCRC